MTEYIINDKQKVGDLVAQFPQTAAIFTRNGIDFCCRGGHSLEHAAEKAGVSLSELLGSLDLAISNKRTEDNPAQLAIPELMDHIVETHHRYVLQQLPVLTTWLTKLAKVHGERHPELIKVKEIFEAMAAGLVVHMRKEEMLLFPKLKKAATAAGSLPNDFDTLLEELVDDHAREGDRMAQIRELSGNFVPPADGCATYRAAYLALNEFEEDLHTHVHLENHVLFQKGKALQANLV